MNNRRKTSLWALQLVVLAAAGASSGVHAATLNTYAGGVGGITNGSTGAGCFTSGTPAELQPFFRGGSFPLGGIAACGLTGGLDSDSGSAGTVESSFTVAPVKLGIPAGNAAVYSGQANATASFGSLGVLAEGRFVGGVANGGPGTYDNTVAAARFTDTLTATSAAAAAGSAGFVRYAFELHGTSSALGEPRSFYTGNTFVELLYTQSTSPGQASWSLALTRGNTGLIQNRTPPAGWTTSTGLLSGASTFFSGDLPIVFGQPWELSVGLVARSEGDATADFLGTARLTGVQVFDSRRQEIGDFQLLAGSGTSYLAPVPEPGSACMLLAGCVALGFPAVMRRRRQAMTAPR